ncbi:MAG: hypothetical protein AAF206_00995 [Bacteroidota bacterium]
MQWQKWSFVLLVFVACQTEKADQNLQRCDFQSVADSLRPVKGALVSTRFSSYEALQASIDLSHENGAQLRHCSQGKVVNSILRDGISQRDFEAARDSGLWEKLSLLLRSPVSVSNRRPLQIIANLSRRRPDLYGESDPAFYDLSAAMMRHLRVQDSSDLLIKDLTSPKGYFNTINHFTSQVFMTALFSEEVADLVADAHERKNIPELIHGNFSPAQIADLDQGPVDNYVDMVNNEWGQEFGKKLKGKYRIFPNKKWTPELLAAFLNDIQSHYTWTFQLDFTPFRPTDEVVWKFSKKMNGMLSDDRISNL